MKFYEVIYTIVFVAIVIFIIGFVPILIKEAIEYYKRIKEKKSITNMKENKRADSREKLTIKPKRTIDRVYSQRITEKTETELFLPFARQFGGNQHSAKKIKNIL